MARIGNIYYKDDEDDKDIKTPSQVAREENKETSSGKIGDIYYSDTYKPVYPKKAEERLGTTKQQELKQPIQEEEEKKKKKTLYGVINNAITKATGVLQEKGFAGKSRGVISEKEEKSIQQRDWEMTTNFSGDKIPMIRSEMLKTNARDQLDYLEKTEKELEELKQDNTTYLAKKRKELETTGGEFNAKQLLSDKQRRLKEIALDMGYFSKEGLKIKDIEKLTFTNNQAEGLLSYIKEDRYLAQQNLVLNDEVVGKIPVNKNIWKEIVKAGKSKSFFPSMLKGREGEQDEDYYLAMKAIQEGASVGQLTPSQRSAIIRKTNQDWEAMIDRGFLAEAPQEISDTTGYMVDHAIANALSGGASLLAGVVSLATNAPRTAQNIRANIEDQVQFTPVKGEDGFVITTTKLGTENDVKGTISALAGNYIEFLVEDWLGDQADKLLAFTGNKLKNTKIAKRLLETPMAEKVGESFIVQSLAKTRKFLNDNPVTQSILKLTGLDSVAGEIAEELVQDMTNSITGGEEYEMNTDYLLNVSAKTAFIVFVTGGGVRVAGAISDIKTQQFVNEVNNNKEAFGIPETAEVSAKNEVVEIKDTETGEIITNKVLNGEIEREVDIETEMLKKDIELKEKEIEGKEVTTDYSQDAQVQEVLRDVSVALEEGARKKNVTQDVEGDAVISVEGVVIPEFIPEELRSRKLLQKAYDAFLENTIPQEGTKAWQVYQSILEESKGREGLEMPEESKGVVKSKIEEETKPKETTSEIDITKDTSVLLQSNNKKVEDLIIKQVNDMTVAERKNYVNAMEKETLARNKDLKVGDKVVFEKIRGGASVGVESAVHTIRTIYKDNGKDRIELIDSDGESIWTNKASIEKVENVKLPTQKEVKKEVVEETIKPRVEKAVAEQPVTEDDFDLDDLPFRQKELKVLEDKFLDTLNIERMKEFSKEYFGDENVELVKNILRNNKALGQYANRLIQIKSGLAHTGSTFYHEAVHKAFDIFLTPNEKSLMIKEVINRVGKKELQKEWNNKTSEEKLRLASYWSNALASYETNLPVVKKNGVGVENIVKKKSEWKGKEELLKSYAESVGIKPENLYASSVQYIDTNTGERVIYLVDGEMDAVHVQTLIDNTEFGIAGEEIGGKRWHITALNPVEFENAYTIVEGKFDLRDLPYSKDISQRSKQREYRDQFGITKKAKGMYRETDSQVASVDAMAEEWLAENIIDYINNRNSTTFWGKLKRMVDVFVDRIFRGVDHIKDIEDFYEGILSGRLLERQQKQEAREQKNWNKYISSIQGAGTKTDAVYRTEVGKEIKKLTTKILKKLEGKTSVKKQFISDLAKQQDIKQVEKDIINDVLKKFPDEIDVSTFEDKVLAELLPLERQLLLSPRYEYVNLPDDLRGDIGHEQYAEVIYDSPIRTSAGETHFGFSMGDIIEAEDQVSLKKDDKVAENYFGHIREENLGETRRILEIQSDLYQKEHIEEETYEGQIKELQKRKESQQIYLNKLRDKEGKFKTTDAEEVIVIKKAIKYLDTELKKAKIDKNRKKLSQYGNPTAHLRMIREEIRQASLDRIKTMLFPTGKTGMMVEGLAGRGNKNFLHYENSTNLKSSDLVKGQKFNDKRNRNQMFRNFVILEKTGEETFKAIALSHDAPEILHESNDGNFSKKYLEVLEKYVKENRSFVEEFSIKEEVDIKNPIYKFYEDTLGKYLKNNYNAEAFTDEKGVGWWRVDIKPEYSEAVEAFRTDELVDYGVIAKKVKWGSLIKEAKKYKSVEKFIESQGRIIYHGSGANFERFSSKRRGSITGVKSAERAIWFTDNEGVAKAYAVYSAETGVVTKTLADADVQKKIAQKSGLDSDWKKYDALLAKAEELDTYDSSYKRRQELANIKEVVIKGDYYIVDAKGKTPQELSSDEEIDSWLNSQLDKALELEKDGVIFKNLDDAVGLYDVPSTHYAVFDSSNIKTKAQLENIWNQAQGIKEAQDIVRYREETTVQLPELISMATELGANIKLQDKFRKAGKRGGFKGGENTDSRIRLLRDLFTPQGEEVIDGATGETTRLPETPEQQMDRIHTIEKVLAHEIGHLFDWFGGEENMTLKRGNILGRIANLKNYTEAEFMHLSNKEIRAELKTLTQIWNPFDETEDPKYKKYRYEAKELYAEAMSVFLNQPSLVKEVAPNFYDSFIEYMTRKKEVQKEYFAIRDMIKEGNEIQDRVDNMNKAQEIATGKRMTIDEETEAYKKQKSWEKTMTLIKMGFSQQYAPYLDKLKKDWKQGRITLSQLEEAEQLMENLAYKGNDAVKYAKDVQREFFKPISEANIDTKTVSNILVLERNLGDRMDLANPHGLVYDYAKETYEKVKGSLNPAQWVLLQKKLDWWRNYNFDLVKKGYEAGVYSEQFFKEIATVNKNTYTPFAVVDYIENNYVTAGIIQARGTTKGVENTLSTQMLKSLSLIKLTATNEAKQDIVKTFTETHADEVIKAKALKNKEGKTIGFEKNPKLERAGYTQLELLEDGKRTAYYVDKYIVGMFDSAMNGIGWDIARIVTSPLRMANRIFKPMVTTGKPSFQFYSNPIKDYTRSVTNLTALSALFDSSNLASRTGKVFKAYTTEWVKNLKRSWNYAGGELDAVTQKMLDMYVLSEHVKYEDIDIGDEKFKFDPVKNKVVYKGGVNWLETLRDYGATMPIIKSTLVPMYDFYMRAGGTFEVNSKIAGFQYLSSQVGEKKGAYYTRKYVGTPDYMQKGKFTPLTNELAVFSNVGIQALTADSHLAFSPKTASGYWLSTAIKVVFPTLLMMLGKEILKVPIPDPDDEDKTIWVNPYDYLGEYYKSMYTAFPIGYNEESESFLFVKIPRDEVGGLIGNLVWKMGTYLQGEGMKVEQLASALAGLIPFVDGDNPLLSIATGWKQYLQGRNPYDDFRGRLAISTNKWNEGGITRFTEMLKWSSNEMGITNFTTYDKSSNTTLEKTLDLPVLERMFELTSYGIREREEWEKAKGKQEKNKTLDNILEGYYAQPSNKKLLELQEKYVTTVKGEAPKDGWEGTDKAEETRLKGEFKREILAQSGNGTYKDIAKSGLSNEEKEKILNSQRKRMSENEFADYLAQVVKYEVVKGEMFAEYAKDKGLSGSSVYKVLKESIPVLSAENNNTLVRELRKNGMLNNDNLGKLRNDNLVTSSGYSKYISILPEGTKPKRPEDERVKRPDKANF